MPCSKRQAQRRERFLKVAEIFYPLEMTDISISEYLLSDFVVLFLFFVVLRIKSTALCKLGKHSITELHPSPRLSSIHSILIS